MNKKGQSLITFILILPLIVLFLAFFVDSSLSIMEKNKIDGIITSNMQKALNSSIIDSNEIKEAILSNYHMDIVVNSSLDMIEIKAKSTKKSLFGKILNFPWYQLEFHYCGNYQDKRIDKECKK